MRARVLWVILVFLGLSLAVPHSINYQGKITNSSGVALDGTYSMTFRIYNVATGGTALWSETHSSVSVHRGLFDVVLGETNPINLPFDEQYYLEIEVAGEVLNPRISLSSVGYVFRSARADTVNWSGIQGVPAGFSDGVDDVDDADNVVGNEYNTGVSFNDATNVLSITDGGGTLTATINNEADNLSDNSIGDLGDVNTSGVSTGQVLKWNGSVWAPADDETGTGGGVGGSGSANYLAIWSDASNLTYNSQLYWDATDNRLGINTTSPDRKLTIYQGDIHLRDEVSTGRAIYFGDGSFVYVGERSGYDDDLLLYCGGDPAWLDALRFVPVSDNSTDLGSSANSWKNLYVDGGIYIDGSAGSSGQVLMTDGSQVYWGNVSGGGDNLGNHTATQNLNMQEYDIINFDYINGGGTSGETGYGIRDSSGYIQYKHSGGSWTTLSEPPPIPGNTEFWVRPSGSSFIRPYYNENAKVYDAGEEFAFYYEGSNDKGSFFAGDDVGVCAHRSSVSSSNLPHFTYDIFPWRDAGNDGYVSSSDSITYTGVYGYGSAYMGVTGICALDAGVRGICTRGHTNSSWPNAGVEGEARLGGSTGDYGCQGVYGWNTEADNTSNNYLIGVLGRTSGTGTMSAGVVGVYTSSVGDLDDFASSSRYAMLGTQNYGAYIYSTSTTAYFETGAGEYGQGPKSVWEGSKWTSDSDDGVEGVTSNSYYYGVHYSGGLGGSGTKSAIIRTSTGPREVYCQESPEVWFEDFGGGEIHNGRCRVDLPSDFAEIVTVDEDHPMRVFITPCGNMGNWWIEKDEKGFILYAPDAPDGTKFDWRVAAKRKHFEDRRLEIRISAYDDPYLYPENMGAYPEEIYEQLKPNADEPYEVYWAEAVSHFQPNDGSPYNYLLPKDWKQIRQKAREIFWKTHLEIAPPEFNNKVNGIVQTPLPDKKEIESK